MVTKKSRRDMEPEELENARRYARRMAKLHHSGRHMMTDATRTRDHLLYLHEWGMSYSDIAAKCGVPRNTLSTIINYQVGNKKTYRATEVAVLAVQPSGDRLSPVGVQRRLQGLWADGFPWRYMAEVGGCSTANLHFAGTRAYRGKNPPGVRFSRLVDGVWQKLRYSDPADHGISPASIAFSKRSAARKGCPPSHCWDEDTIDDPRAIPEWTGACGTYQGYRIHKRDDIPACDPCCEARRLRKELDGRSQFNGPLLREVRERAGISGNALALEVGVNPSTITYWEKNRSQPKEDMLDRVCARLGVDPEMFYEEEH